MILALGCLQKIRLLTVSSLLVVSGFVVPTSFGVWEVGAGGSGGTCEELSCVSRIQLREGSASLSMGDRSSKESFDMGRPTHLKVAGYVPPTCSDTDADQSNNCGPGDSGDAGTRLSV